jgi:hypothetical protein
MTVNGQSYAARSATTSTGTPSLKLNRDPLGSLTESFQSEVVETADVSLTLETVASCKCPSRQNILRNRTQEADGSIPFISTISLRIS